jgi:hypothetical protein
MLPDPFRLTRPVRWSLALLGILLAASSGIAKAFDLLEQTQDALSLNDPKGRYHLQLSGLLDLETYIIDQPASGLLFTDDEFLFNPRLRLFLDAQFGSNIYVFAQVRADRGFDPSDKGAQLRLDEYLFRYFTSGSTRLSVQAGQFATVIGNWVPRHDSWQDAFITAPFPYENLTGVWDVYTPGNARTLLEWGHVDGYDGGDYSDKILRLPIVWGPSYASGFAISGTAGRFDFAAEVTNTALAARPESWRVTQTGFENPTYSVHVAFRPDERWNFGLSGSGGPYLTDAAEPSLPPGRDIGDYHELVVAQDVSFAWHHLQFWAEFFEARFEVPLVGNADTFSYYLEAKYKVTPQLFAALRWNQQLFGSIHNGTTDTQWGNNMERIDAAMGYRFTNYLQLKLQYSLSHREAEVQEGEHLLSAQLTLKF